MSIITLIKEDKQCYLTFILVHLWQGYLYIVLDYLKNTVKAKMKKDDWN